MLGVLALLIPCSPAAAGTFSGPGLTINDSATPPTLATPYPSTITVSGELPIVTSVRVRVFGFTHQFPDEVDLLLVGPRGQSVMLMSDAGIGAETNESFTVNDTAPALTDTSGIGGTFAPTDIDDDTADLDAFPAPAPAGPYGSSVNALAQSTANGTWRLYAVDDSEDDAGSIGGWELRISSRDPWTVGLYVPLLSPPFGYPETAGSVRVVVDRGFTAGLRAGSVAYATWPLSGDPRPGVDYVPRIGRLEWAAGQSGSRPIDIPILNDATAEQQECILFQLSDPSGDLALPGGASQIVCIADDDRAPLPPLVPNLGGAKVQRPLGRRAVIVNATPSLAGTLTATGTIRIPRSAAAVVRLRSVRRQVVAGRKVSLRLRLSKPGVRAVRRAFKVRRRLRATVRVTLKGGLGRTATERRRITLKR